MNIEILVAMLAGCCFGLVVAGIILAWGLLQLRGRVLHLEITSKVATQRITFLERRP